MKTIKLSQKGNAMMNFKEAIYNLEIRFVSGNEIEVERTHITRKEFEAIKAAIEATKKKRQCPICQELKHDLD